VKKEINYNRIKEIEKSEYLEVSAGLLKKNIDCTESGRKLCDGRCCKGHVNEKQDGKVFVRYSKEELESFPKEVQKEVYKYISKDLIVQNKDGVCVMIDFCLKNPKYKPIECKLFPFSINSNGKLIVDRWAIFHCPNFGRGKISSYISLKDNLIDVFGEACYKNIVKQVEKKQYMVDEWL